MNWFKKKETHYEYKKRRLEETELELKSCTDAKEKEYLQKRVSELSNETDTADRNQKDKESRIRNAAIGAGATLGSAAIAYAASVVWKELRYKRFVETDPFQMAMDKIDKRNQDTTL